MKDAKTTNVAPSRDALKLAISCGIPPHLDGCNYTARAADIFADGTTSFMRIYRIIAHENGIDPESVMRSISYAVSHSIGINVKLSELLGINIPPYPMHNGLVISYLALCLRRKELSAER